MYVGMQLTADGWRVVDCSDPPKFVFGFGLTEAQAYEIAQNLNHAHGKNVPVLLAAKKQKKRAWQEGRGWPDGLDRLRLPGPVPPASRKPPSSKNRRRRLRRTKWTESPHCHYCKRKLEWEETTLDHVYPQSKGGPTNRSNTVLACKTCNNRKGDQLPEVLPCGSSTG